MIKNHYNNILLLIIFTVPVAANHDPIILKSELLATVDGKHIGINGDTLSQIKKYQANIMDILRGKRLPSGTREGIFEFYGKKYSVAELKDFEDHNQLSADDQRMLIKKMRDYFESISLEFKPVAQGTKPIMSLLIVESCQLRNRNDSLLVAWSKTKEADEAVLFDRHVKTIKDFEIFLIDLYNFLNDLCHSCPKAMQQFKERIERFNKIKSLATMIKIAKNQEAAFIKFASKSLDHINPGEITEQKIKELYTAFNQHPS